MSGVSFKINQFNSTDRCFLTEMPAEILFNIHSHLETKDSVSLSNTCNYLFNQREIKSKNSYELFEIKKFITNLITKLDKITEVKINILHIVRNQNILNLPIQQTLLRRVSSADLENEIAASAEIKSQLTDLRDTISHLNTDEKSSLSAIERRFIEITAPLNLLNFEEIVTTSQKIINQLKEALKTMDDSNPESLVFLDILYSLNDQLLKDSCIKELSFFRSIFIASNLFQKQKIAIEAGDIEDLSRIDQDIKYYCDDLIAEKRFEEAFKLAMLLTSEEWKQDFLSLLLKNNELTLAKNYLPQTSNQNLSLIKLYISYYKHDKKPEDQEILDDLNLNLTDKNDLLLLAKAYKFGLSDSVISGPRYRFINTNVLQDIIRTELRELSAALNFGSGFEIVKSKIKDNDEVLELICNLDQEEKEHILKNICMDFIDSNDQNLILRADQISEFLNNTPNDNFWYILIKLYLMAQRSESDKIDLQIELLSSAYINHIKKNDLHHDVEIICIKLINSGFPKIGPLINSQTLYTSIIDCLIENSKNDSNHLRSNLDIDSQSNDYLDQALEILPTINYEYEISNNLINTFLELNQPEKAILAAKKIVPSNLRISFFFTIYKYLLNTNQKKLALKIADEELSSILFQYNPEMKIVNLLIDEGSRNCSLESFEKLYPISILLEKIKDKIEEQEKDEIVNTIIAYINSKTSDKLTDVLYTILLEKERPIDQIILMVQELNKIKNQDYKTLPSSFDTQCYRLSRYFLAGGNPNEALAYANMITNLDFSTADLLNLYLDIIDFDSLCDHEVFFKSERTTILSLVAQRLIDNGNIEKASLIAPKINNFYDSRNEIQSLIIQSNFTSFNQTLIALQNINSGLLTKEITTNLINKKYKDENLHDLINLSCKQPRDMIYGAILESEKKDILFNVIYEKNKHSIFSIFSILYEIDNYIESINDKKELIFNLLNKYSLTDISSQLKSFENLDEIAEEFSVKTKNADIASEKIFNENIIKTKPSFFSVFKSSFFAFFSNLINIICSFFKS